MTKNKSLCDKYDLRSVRALFTGAAPLGGETAEDLQQQYPEWKIRQGYGIFPFIFPPPDGRPLTSTLQDLPRQPLWSAQVRPTTFGLVHLALYSPLMKLS